ncbi:MAG: hypothetical protein WD894_21225 [Pirellulales bacterium]
MKQDVNIYTVMLMLSFLATVIACLFLYFELRTYDMERQVPPELRAPTSLPSGPVGAIAAIAFANSAT